MTLSQHHLDIVSRLYDAAIDPNRWTESLDQLAAEIGAKSSALLILETLNEYRYSISKCSSHINLQPEDARIYERDYSKYEAEHFARVAKMPAGKIIKEIDYVDDPNAYRYRPDVAFLEQRFGIFERFAVRLNEEKAWFDCITFQYDTSRPNITRAEVEVLRQFIPHIAKTTNLSRTFIELKNRYSAVLGVLDRLFVGVFLLLDSGEVLLKNTTADNLVSKQDGLFITRDKKLSCSDSRTSRQLKLAIKNACGTAAAEKNSGSARLKVARPSGNDSYLVDISPIRDTDKEIDAHYRGAIAMVIDCDQRLPININGLQTLYELTAAEASVAQHLIEGKKVNEVAEIRGTSPETVKSQAKSIFSKTQSNSRTELFNRLLSVQLPIE